MDPALTQPSGSSYAKQCTSTNWNSRGTAKLNQFVMSAGEKVLIVRRMKHKVASASQLSESAHMLLSSLTSIIAHNQYPSSQTASLGVGQIVNVGGFDDLLEERFGSFKAVAVKCPLKFVGNIDQQILHSHS